MLTFSGSLRVFIALDPCDMRAGINTLLALTGEKLREDPKSGSLFVFTNKRHRLLKVLYWDGSGFWMMTKPKATHCPHSIYRKNLLSPSSPPRTGTGGAGLCRRFKKHGVCQAARHHHTGYSVLDDG